MTVARCPGCGADLDPAAKVCPYCFYKVGTGLSASKGVLVATAAALLIGALASAGFFVWRLNARQQQHRVSAQSDAEQQRMASLAIKAIRLSMANGESIRFDLLGVNEAATIACARVKFVGSSKARPKHLIFDRARVRDASDKDWAATCQGLRDYVWLSL